MRRSIVLLALIAVTAHAADGGAAPADAGSGPRALFVLADDEAAIDKYVLAKPSERAAIKGILTKVTIGKRTAGAILVEGYELPYSRRVDVSADLVITDPEGREVIDKASISGARTMDPKTMLLLPLKPVFGLMFGLTDREGEYKVRITVWDHVRGSSTSLETRFVVTR